MMNKVTGGVELARPFRTSNYQHDRGDFKFETADSIIQEVERQHSIYTNSLFPILPRAPNAPPNQCSFDPLCPSIISYAIGITGITWLRNTIIGKLLRRTPNFQPSEDPYTRARRQDDQILDDFFNYARYLRDQNGPGTGLSIIVMEFMSHSMTLENFASTGGLNGGPISQETLQYAYECVYMQLFRLGALGFRHGDCHPGNIMIHYNHMYGDRRGNAFLIDFGDLIPILPVWAEVTRTDHPLLALRIPNWFVIPPFDRHTILERIEAMYRYNRRYLEDSRMQIIGIPNAANGTLDNFIEYIIINIIRPQMYVARRIHGGGGTPSDNTDNDNDNTEDNTNKKMSWKEFEQMIKDDIAPPVKFDLNENTFNIPLKDDDERKFGGKSLKKSLLNKRRRTQGGSHKRPLNKRRHTQSWRKRPFNKSRRSQIPKSTYNSKR
jgi:hypothetical protein